MEAFSDGVIAIIITIMVLGIAAPEGATLRDLLRLLPAIAAYAVSFVGVGTYWNNHHHLLKLVRHVDGRMLWSNLAFLFVLSFFPLATDWMQKTSFASLPTTCYVVLNMLVSLTYMNLERVIRHALGHGCRATAPSEEELSRRAVIEKRAYLPRCVRDMVLLGEDFSARWYTAGPRSRAGHPHHPLYLKKDSPSQQDPKE